VFGLFFKILGYLVLPLVFTLTASAACVLPDLRTNERPNINGAATEITATFVVADFLGVDDANQKLDLDLIGEFTWQDPRLRGLENCRFNVTEVWFPKIELYNSSQLRAARTNALNQVSVGEDGQVTYWQRYTGLISSYHNLRNFPFDHHDFKIEIGAVEDGSNELLLLANNSETWISERLNIEGWNVSGVGLSSALQFVRQSKKEVSVLSLVISASRISDYYIYRVLILLGFVVAMSWVIFWIPPSRFEFQIGLGATSMLTIIAFNLAIASQLPQLGYLTILDKMLIWAILLVFLSILEALAAGLLVMRGHEDTAVRLDKFSRILFPVLLFVIWIGLVLAAD
jgi:hypothetical protein